MVKFVNLPSFISFLPTFVCLAHFKKKKIQFWRFETFSKTYHLRSFVIFIFHRNKVTVFPIFWPHMMITNTGQTGVKGYRKIILSHIKSST